MKTKLKVGEWYRSEYCDGLIKPLTQQEDQIKDCRPTGQDFIKCDLIDSGGALVKNTFIYWPKKWFDSMYLMETLTPSEALILLGKGFVLVKKRSLYKVGENGYLEVKFSDEKCFSKLPVMDYNGFKIHALPESDDG